MSLINQMLKDLDARRSDVPGSSPFGQQIRAVPERRRIHPAWWVATALGGTLIGVLGFVLLRPDAPAGAGVSAQLPLKLDMGLVAGGASPNPALTDASRTAPDSGTVVVPADVSTAPPGVVSIESPKEALVVPAPELTPPDTKFAPAKTSVVPPPAKERPASAPSAAEAAPAPKMIAPSPHIAEVPAASAINKQVKELTAQQRAENEYRKALLALQQGKRAEAAAGLDQALQIDPKHAGARQSLIAVLLDAKQQDEAILKAREGLVADPAQTGLAMILARLQLEKGVLKAAIETLERSLPHATEKADYQAFLAALLQRDERHKQAVEHYLLAVQKTPQNGVWWMGLGISLQAEQRTADALESFKRAKASNSLSPELLAFVETRIGSLQR